MRECYAIRDVTIYIDDVDILQNEFKFTRKNEKAYLTIKHECIPTEFGSIFKKMLYPSDRYFSIKMKFSCIWDTGESTDKEIKLWGKLADGDIYNCGYEMVGSEDDRFIDFVVNSTLCFEIIKSSHSFVE